MKEINLKGLEHGEREKLIFPEINELESGNSLKLINDFNPVPLVQKLKTSSDFDVDYETDGPDEWVLNIKRTGDEKDNGKDRKALKELLREIKDSEVTEETKEKAKELFSKVDATTLGMIEQELIEEGITHDEIRESLCDLHLEQIGEDLVENRVEVEAPHPVHTLMEEHDFIVESLEALEALLERLDGMKSFKDMGDDLEELEDLAHHLVEAENHHQREEDVLFPRLREHNVVEPPNIMETDHEEFKAKKKKLLQTAANPENFEFPEFKKEVKQLGDSLVSSLQDHIFKENNILYQIALEVLDEEEWDEIKKECDNIGYCCFSPEDQE